MSSPLPLAKIGNYLRLAAAVIRGGTVRFYTGDLKSFYADMNDADINYVVLRWSDHVPRCAQEEAASNDDIDHLIADDQTWEILEISSRHHGGTKCDYYSVSGQQGSSYRSMPYYMPALAERLLKGRVLDPRGFFRPDPVSEFFAFAYHLCYHKGHRCGILIGGGFNGTVDVPKKDYVAELRGLAKAAGDIALPEPLTLLALHELLRSSDWNMPYDLMVRWPDQHPFMATLIEYEQSLATTKVERCKGLTVFILREDGDAPDMVQLATRMISERFTPLETVILDETQQDRVIRQTRGGDWVEKYCGAVVRPTVAIICRNAPSPGPLPIPMSPAKVKKRYPHVANTDVLIKRRIRDEINAATPSSFDRVVIHATDNAFECAETLSAIFGDGLDSALGRFSQT
ncbi:hypothetical protein SAMN04490248_12348 [Salinihabitans flavidus]|uniref:Uncharacterized protein n=1 Tax=Salinihabitans flavidus TaxID=569882 RepID=A0A1H8UYP6_9RHOB|nr:hypothetical protein [Salinihabitans flavidus]SEP08271.1 hypothetical protein SAMN04490248_12348 [Salinihabitans flavidus]